MGAKSGWSGFAFYPVGRSQAPGRFRYEARSHQRPSAITCCDKGNPGFSGLVGTGGRQAKASPIPRWKAHPSGPESYGPEEPKIAAMERRRACASRQTRAAPPKVRKRWCATWRSVPSGSSRRGEKEGRRPGASKSADDDVCLDWPFAAIQASYLGGATEHLMNPNASLLDRAGLDKVRVGKLIDRGLEGADDGELFLEYKQSEMLVFDNGRLKQATYDTNQGFGLRAVKDEAVGYAHASDVSEAAICARRRRGARGQGRPFRQICRGPGPHQPQALQRRQSARERRASTPR